MTGVACSDTITAAAPQFAICDKLNGGPQMAFAETSIQQQRHSRRPPRGVLTGTDIAKVVGGRAAAATKYGRTAEACLQSNQ